MPPPAILWGLILLAICHLFFGFLALWFAQEIGGRLGRIAGRNKPEALAGAILWTLLLVAAFGLWRTFSDGFDHDGSSGQALSVLVRVILFSPFVCLAPLLLIFYVKTFDARRRWRAEQLAALRFGRLDRDPEES